MGVIREDFKFKKVENFLSKDEIDLANLYCEMAHRTNLTNFDDEKRCANSDTAFYGDKLTDSLLLKKKELVEKESGKKLLPTYSYWRMYTKFSDLKKHTDRPSCEISVTVNIGSDGTQWPIFIEGNEIILNRGDAVIYLGIESPHWREKFLGDWCAQCFLHYVDVNGKNTEWFMDKRVYWGIESKMYE